MTLAHGRGRRAFAGSRTTCVTRAATLLASTITPGSPAPISTTNGTSSGDRFSLPNFPVADLAAAVERVRALGGEIVHPGEQWVICRDSEGTPFGLVGSPSGAAG